MRAEDGGILVHVLSGKRKGGFRHAVFFKKYTDVETHLDILPMETEIDTQCEAALARLTLKI